MTDLEFYALATRLRSSYPKESGTGQLAQAGLQRLEELNRLRKVLEQVFREGCGEDSDIAARALQESWNASSASWEPDDPESP